MSAEQSLAYFNYIRITDKEVFEKPETWDRDTVFYMNLLEKYPDQKWFWSWNWAAAIFGEFWMIYRRMFLDTFLFFIACFLIKIFPSLLVACFDYNGNIAIFAFEVLYKKNIIVDIFNILLFPLFGLIANPLYLNHVKRKVKAEKTHKSGTSWILVIIAFSTFFAVRIAMIFLNVLVGRILLDSAKLLQP